jgi:hypothetical protein
MQSIGAILRFWARLSPDLEGAMAQTDEPSDSALALRRAIYGKGDATRADLEMLLAQGRRQRVDSDFAALLAEVATDVMIHQVDPEGYVTDADADWLMARLGKAGGLASGAEFAMLEAVIGRAVDIPPALTAFAMDEAEKSTRAAGVVTADDVTALQAFAFAPTRGSSLHVDRATAEVLFNIAHATAGAANDAEFAGFFAKAVGNYLMGVAFAGTPARADVLAHEAELDKPTGFGAFLSQMAHRASLDTLATALESVEGIEEDAYARENDDEARSERDAEKITGDEAKWVIAHLTREGALTEAEKRLLLFLRDEAASAPPELAALFDKAA